MGATAAGIYTVALAELGERFSGHELVTGTASFSTMWGMGALAGRWRRAGPLRASGRMAYPSPWRRSSSSSSSPPSSGHEGPAAAPHEPDVFSYGAGVLFVAAGAACWSLAARWCASPTGIDVWQIIFYRSLDRAGLHGHLAGLPLPRRLRPAHARGRCQRRDRRGGDRHGGAHLRHRPVLHDGGGGDLHDRRLALPLRHPRTTGSCASAFRPSPGSR